MAPHPAGGLPVRRISKILTALALLLATFASPGIAGPDPIPLGTKRPLVAIWRQSDGHRPSSGAPFLRIAIWEEGRVLVAADPGRWEHRLREGRISADGIVSLKKKIAATGVFNLKGSCYLVPDAPVDCLLLDFGGQRQMLYWDEVESANYGINIAPKPHRLEFKECWKAVNRLALASCPREVTALPGRFGPVPQSWYLKPAVQSE